MNRHADSLQHAVMSGLAVLFALSASAVADPGAYTFRAIDPPVGQPGIDVRLQILWINNSGTLTLQYQKPITPQDPLANMHTAVLWQEEWTIIDVPGAVSSGGTNANNRGQVVVSHEFGDGVWRAAIWDRGSFEPIAEIPGYPGGMVVQGVNNLGQLAATVIDADNISHGFVGDPDSFVVFDYPDPAATGVLPMMLNDRGVVVGSYDLADGSFHAFRLAGGEFVNIDPPGSVWAQATGINNRGAIVGVYFNGSAVLGFVLESDRYTDFQVPDARLTLPYSINDRGQIAGIYVDVRGHGFVATPVGTEP